jgi:hypothetical protein
MKTVSGIVLLVIVCGMLAAFAWVYWGGSVQTVHVLAR